MSEHDTDDPVAVALREAAAGVPGAAERFWRLRGARVRVLRECERQAHQLARERLARRPVELLGSEATSA